MRLPTSATALMRLQFEAVTRALWLLYAANENDVAKLHTPLNLESERAANNLHSVREMIDQIAKKVGMRAPAAARQMLLQFKEVTGRR